MLFDMVSNLLLLGNWKLRYESLCRYTLLIFLYFSLISHVFINIHENLNLMFYKLDHFGKRVVSMHWLKIRFGTIGHLTTEIWEIMDVHPLDFSAIFHSFPLFPLNTWIFMMNIFHNIPYGKSTMSKHWIGTRFDTLEHMVGETFVILNVHPLIFLRFFSFITKVFINIHEYANEIKFSYRTTG